MQGGHKKSQFLSHPTDFSVGPNQLPLITEPKQTSFLWCS